MKLTRRRVCLGAAAAVAAPALVGRTWAAEGGAALPIPSLLELGSSNRETLVAIEGTREFIAGLSTPVLGFGQAFLGPVLRVQRGSTVRVELRNRMRDAFTVHWHGLHVSGDVDGGPHTPIEPGASWSPSLDIDQPAATLWYHSHRHGATGPQVNAGLAGMLIVDDPAAPGSALPVRYGVDDLPLVIQDRAFAANGRFAYGNAGMALMAGWRGNRILVNGAILPQAGVPAGIVRLRLLNGSNARIYHLRFEDGRPLHVVGSDGGLLASPIALQRLTLAPGERAEVLVDFAPGGARLLSDPDLNSPMAGMMGRGRMMGMGGMGGMGLPPDPPAVAGGGSFEVMRFVVDAMRTAEVLELPTLLAGAAPAPALGEPVMRRRLVIGGGSMTGGMGMMGMTINSRAFDMQRIDARVRRGETELWQIVTSNMAHPFHVHGTSFQVLSRNGVAADFATTGWKDTLLVQGSAEILMRFDHLADEHHPFMYHCHILEHEDAGMMGQFTVT